MSVSSTRPYKSNISFPNVSCVGRGSGSAGRLSTPPGRSLARTRHAAWGNLRGVPTSWQRRVLARGATSIEAGWSSEPGRRAAVCRGGHPNHESCTNADTREGPEKRQLASTGGCAGLAETVIANRRRVGHVPGVEDPLQLRLPTLDEEQEFLRAHRATSPEVRFFLHYYTEGMPLARYLEQLRAFARGEGLPTLHVPSTFLFAFVASRIVGRVSIRHRLDEDLRMVGGHIGYVVVPEFRRRGYATRILGAAARIARESLGISPILVTCDDDNLGSIRAIERNGGRLENVVSGYELGAPKRRYWIG